MKTPILMAFMGVVCWNCGSAKYVLDVIYPENAKRPVKSAPRRWCGNCGHGWARSTPRETKFIPLTLKRGTAILPSLTSSEQYVFYPMLNGIVKRESSRSNGSVKQVN
ncbi:MAG: hypothetical protein AB7W16_14070 [Candidatus Obscuribacterales bacterium]